MKTNRGGVSVVILFVMACFVLAMAGNAWAGDTNWQGTTGDWFEPTNWTAGVPSASDNARINNGGTAAISTPTAQARADYLYAGSTATGTVAQTAGINTVTNDVHLGYSSGSTGKYQLTGTGRLSAKNEYIGNSGTGSFSQDGGMNTISTGGYLYLGHQAGGAGTYELGGTGSLSAGYEFIGNGGAGTFRQNAGNNTLTHFLNLGQSAGSTGTYELGGTGFLSVPREFIGNYGSGTFRQDGGSNTMTNEMYLAFQSGSSGTYELDGTGMLFTGNAYIGYRGTGIFRQTGGTCSPSGPLYLGYQSGSTGTYELSGTGVLSTQLEYIGNAGNGTFRQTGGTNTISMFVHIAGQAGSLGAYELGGTGVLFALEENVAVRGTATFTQTGGTNEVDTLFLGRNLGSTGTYTISGGVLSSPTVCVGYDGAGTLSITGAAAQISVSNFLRFGADSTFTSVPGGTIHMTGAALENLSTAPADLAGLANLTLIFEGGTGVTDDFEAAGQDKGADLSGWTANFALGTLQLGGAAAGRVALVDTFDNQPGWVGDEALYTDTLIMNAGATIDPGGLNLYYLNGGGPKQFFRGDAKLDGNVDVLDLAALGNNFESTGATWAKADFNGDELVDVLDLAILANNFGSETGGSVGTPIPEPASASLVAVGLGVLLARRRRRRAPADYRILKRPVQPVE